MYKFAVNTITIMKKGVVSNMNNKVIKIVKILSLAATIVGTIGSAWVGSKENKMLLTKLVDEHFQNN